MSKSTHVLGKCCMHNLCEESRAWASSEQSRNDRNRGIGSWQAAWPNDCKKFCGSRQIALLSQCAHTNRWSIFAFYRFPQSKPKQNEAYSVRCNAFIVQHTVCSLHHSPFFAFYIINDLVTFFMCSNPATGHIVQPLHTCVQTYPLH